MTPRFAEQWDWLREQAERRLAQREARYPDLVAAGKLAEAEAERGLRIMRAIVADWQFATFLEGEPGDDATPLEKSRELAALVTDWRAHVEKAPDDEQRIETLEAVETLLWHQRRLYGPVFCARTTIEARAQAKPVAIAA